MQFKFAELMASDAQLLGRVTYEGFARAWPTMEGTGAFGEKMNAMPKFVASSTLAVAEWNNTTILHGDLAEEVGKLKPATTQMQVYEGTKEKIKRALTELPKLAKLVKKPGEDDKPVAVTVAYSNSKVKSACAANHDCAARIQEVVNHGPGFIGHKAVSAIKAQGHVHVGNKNGVAFSWTGSTLKIVGYGTKNNDAKAGNDVIANASYNTVGNYTSPLGEKPYTSGSVFNFFPPNYVIPGTTFNAPEFGQENTATAVLRLSLANTLVYNGVSGFTVDLSKTSALGITASATGNAMTDSGNLVDSLGVIFMHGQMPTQMRTAIVNHIATLTDPAQRVRVATYLVITSSFYKIEH